VRVTRVRRGMRLRIELGQDTRRHPSGSHFIPNCTPTTQTLTLKRAVRARVMRACGRFQARLPRRDRADDVLYTVSM
jgi:hypothetical protein